MWEKLAAVEGHHATTHLQGFGGAESAPDGLSEPFWLNCQNKGRQKGRLLVQVQFIQRVRVRPLKVLVVTWNMGSAPPSASFSKCFPDSETCDPFLLTGSAVGCQVLHPSSDCIQLATTAFSFPTLRPTGSQFPSHSSPLALCESKQADA